MMILQRREFIAGLGGAAAWPLAAWAQQSDRVRRIGVLMPRNENAPVATPSPVLSAFTQALADLGWTYARNVRMDVRWYGDDINRTRALALCEHGRPRRQRHRRAAQPAGREHHRLRRGSLAGRQVA
jgi:hypothetical protein